MNEKIPVGWFEAPYGKFRANPLYKLSFPSQLLDWKIPVYLEEPQNGSSPKQSPPADCKESAQNNCGNS